MSSIAKLENLKGLVVELRGQSALLDSDVADLYRVETKRINEAVKNNPDKFPSDYMFDISEGEFEDLRSKFSTTKFAKTRALPKAFTERCQPPERNCGGGIRPFNLIGDPQYFHNLRHIIPRFTLLSSEIYDTMAVMNDYNKFTAMLASEFHRYMMENEKNVPVLPTNVLIIFEVEGEEDFNRWHKEMSLRNKEVAQPVAYVQLKKWRMHSCIEAMTLIGTVSEKENTAPAKRF